MKNRKKWSDEEIEFLRQHYPQHGLVYCENKLGRSKASIACRIAILGIPRNRDVRYDFETFSKVVEKSINYADTVRNLGLVPTCGNRQTVKSYIEKYGLDISHFYIPVPKLGKKFSLKDILVENSPYKHTTDLKEKLYKEGLKERCCELCGQGEEWRGKKMSLILDHINGVNNDNRLDNLRIVCPNCNATLDTHCRGSRNKKVLHKEKKNLKSFCSCGEEKYHESKDCISCSLKKQRKVERPPLEQLLKEIEELGYSATGRKYGVSDNAIRKWIKRYDKTTLSTSVQ